MTPKEHLIAARALIEKPENWTQGHLAKNSSGRRVCPTLDSAVCFCSIGALQRTSVGIEKIDIFASLYVVEDILHGDGNFLSLGFYNDTHTHAEVLDLFDRAIASL